MPELELDPQKVYKMPAPLFVEMVDNHFLVIARDTANWLLLKNQQQLEVFDFLAKKHSVAELFNVFSADAQADIYAVLIELEAKHFESIEVHYPPEHGMYMYLTNRCNQRCRHCYMYAGEANHQELSSQEVEYVLSAFAKSGGTVVTFTGGEATLRSDFKTIVAFAKDVGLKVGVLSNGLLWSRDFVDDIKPYIDEVQISIDGFDADSYRCVRGTDSFDTALNAVERLVNADLRVAVAVTPLQELLIANEDQYISFAKRLMSKYEGKPFSIKFNTELMPGRKVSPTSAENDAYHKASVRIKTACMPLSEEKGFALDHAENTVFNNCGYGGLTITATGDVYFCNLIGQCAKQANIRTHSFESILSLAAKARTISDINNLVPCRDCTLKYLCGGGCRVKFFKRLVNSEIATIEDVSFAREVPCSDEQKEKIFRLMIQANRFFYR